MSEYADFFNRVSPEIAMLIEPDANEMACIIEGPGGKFVQFENSPSQGEDGILRPTLRLDLPCQALSRLESERAAQPFAEYGVTGPSEYAVLWVRDEYDDMGKAGFTTAWKLDCGPNIERAANVAAEVLDKVFGIHPGEVVRVEAFEF